MFLVELIHSGACSWRRQPADFGRFASCRWRWGGEGSPLVYSWSQTTARERRQSQSDQLERLTRGDYCVCWAAHEKTDLIFMCYTVSLDLRFRNDYSVSYQDAPAVCCVVHHHHYTRLLAVHHAKRTAGKQGNPDYSLNNLTNNQSHGIWISELIMIKQAALTRPCDPQRPGWTPPCPARPPRRCGLAWGRKEFGAPGCPRGPSGNGTQARSRDPRPTCWGWRASSVTDEPSPSPEEVERLKVS